MLQIRVFSPSVCSASNPPPSMALTLPLPTEILLSLLSSPLPAALPRVPPGPREPRSERTRRVPYLPPESALAARGAAPAGKGAGVRSGASGRGHGFRRARAAGGEAGRQGGRDGREERSAPRHVRAVSFLLRPCACRLPPAAYRPRRLPPHARGPPRCRLRACFCVPSPWLPAKRPFAKTRPSQCKASSPCHFTCVLTRHCTVPPPSSPSQLPFPCETTAYLSGLFQRLEESVSISLSDSLKQLPAAKPGERTDYRPLLQLQAKVCNDLMEGLVRVLREVAALQDERPVLLASWRDVFADLVQGQAQMWITGLTATIIAAGGLPPMPEAARMLESMLSADDVQRSTADPTPAPAVFLLFLLRVVSFLEERAVEALVEKMGACFQMHFGDGGEDSHGHSATTFNRDAVLRLLRTAQSRLVVGYVQQQGRKLSKLVRTSMAVRFHISQARVRACVRCVRLHADLGARLSIDLFASSAPSHIHSLAVVSRSNHPPTPTPQPLRSFSSPSPSTPRLRFQTNRTTLSVSVQAPNWLTLKEPRDVRPVCDFILTELHIVESEVSQLMEADGGGGGGGGGRSGHGMGGGGQGQKQSADKSKAIARNVAKLFQARTEEGRGRNRGLHGTCVVLCCCCRNRSSAKLLGLPDARPRSNAESNRRS